MSQASDACAPVPLDLKGYKVGCSAITITFTAPRSGTPLADVVDGVFPAGNALKWFMPEFVCGEMRW